MTTADQARETQRRRFQFLQRCYEVSQGSLHKILKTREIREELNLGYEVTEVIVRYLHDRGLLEVMDQRGRVARMTSLGIDEVEKALVDPEKPTEHFPAFNIIQIAEMTDSQIQQASPAATQIVFADGKQEELAGLVESLKDSIGELGLNDQEKSDLQADILTIEAQTSKSAPNRAIITASLKSAWRILEAAAGGALAVGFIETIKFLLAG